MRCGSRLFASHCQEEIKENLPLPSGPSGIVGAGGWQWCGWAILRAPNCWHQQHVSSVFPVWSRDLIRSGLQSPGGQTQDPHTHLSWSLPGALDTLTVPQIL